MGQKPDLGQGGLKASARRAALELAKAQPWSSRQLANLLAGFPGWLSLQVGEAAHSWGFLRHEREPRRLVVHRGAVLGVGMLEGYGWGFVVSPGSGSK